MCALTLPDESTPFGARVRERLRTETVVWLTTVGADGTPKPNPVWFLWDGADEIIVYNRADANRLTHVEQRPRVSLNFDGNGRGGDVVVLTGDARIADDVPPSMQNEPYAAKYAEAAARVSGDVEKFAADYPVALRIKLTRVRGF